MAKKQHTPEQIIFKLREAEVMLAQGKTVLQVCRELGVTDNAVRLRNVKKVQNPQGIC